VISDLSRIREARMNELKQQIANTQRFKALGHGEYTEITQVLVSCAHAGTHDL
jgi:hypothetical protein